MVARTNLERLEGRRNGQSVCAVDPLGLTVLYEVSHHESDSATLNHKGLELITSAELVAIIPVDQNFANHSER